MKKNRNNGIIIVRESVDFQTKKREVFSMRYIEIGQDIINAIKGGAGWDGKSESDEAVEALNSYSSWFAAVVREVISFVKYLSEAFSK